MAAFFGVVYVLRDAFLYLSHPECLRAAAFLCMADLSLLLGLRYLRLLCGHAHWKAQDGSCLKPEEVQSRELWEALWELRFWV